MKARIFIKREILQKCDGKECKLVTKLCNCVMPNNGLFCTRPYGHKGNHIACGSGSYHNLKSWK